MWKKPLVALRGIVEPRGKKAHEAARLVEEVQSIIKRLEGIVGDGGKDAREVAGIIQQLMEMPDWIDGEYQGIRDKAESELDRLCRKIALTLDELVAMLAYHEQIEFWDGADLCAFRDEALKHKKRKEDEEAISARAAEAKARGGRVASNNGRHPLTVEQEQSPDAPKPRQIVADLAEECEVIVKSEKAKRAEAEKTIDRKDKEILRLNTANTNLLLRLREQADKIKQQAAEIIRLKDELRSRRGKSNGRKVLSRA